MSQHCVVGRCSLFRVWQCDLLYALALETVLAVCLNSHCCLLSLCTGTLSLRMPFFSRHAVAVALLGLPSPPHRSWLTALSHPMRQQIRAMQFACLP